jgi:coenzyme F420-0:L-glutamate ligase/coenzyme F420-1:gamma-L-glutamate ligase
VITATAIEGLPEVAPGDDLAALLMAQHAFKAEELLVVAHKVVSKAEGRIVKLDGVSPGAQAQALAAKLDKDPRVVEVILGETAEVVRAERNVLICRTHQGFVCANAGVDASNAPGGSLVLLPRDSDASARALRKRLGVAVVIADSFGRAWRHAQCDVAIGAAGVAPIDDWRGRADAHGRDLRATAIAVVDQAAAAADLARAGKDAEHPAVVVTGLQRHLLDEDGPGVAELIRARDEDFFT